MERKQVIIVTGANTGIGLETAKNLCELGHDVVISVRDDAKGEATIANIKAQVPNSQIMYIKMEMSDPQSIRRFVRKFQATGKPLHVLINNAGVFKLPQGSERFIARGDAALEMTMTVNCMGAFLLTNLLLDVLKATATVTHLSRIVNVSAAATIQQKTDFFIDDLMLAEEAHYKNGTQAYRNSKLAMNLWSRELAKRLEGSNVISNTVCPGFIPSTDLSRDNVTIFGKFLNAKCTTLTASEIRSLMFKFLDSFIDRFLAGSKPVSVGAQQLIRMAFDDNTNTTGLFYSEGKPVKEADEVLDSKNREKIWDLCVKYSGL